MISKEKTVLDSSFQISSTNKKTGKSARRTIFFAAIQKSRNAKKKLLYTTYSNFEAISLYHNSEPIKKMSSNNAANAVLTAKGADGDSAMPFCGCICCFNACYTEWPNCIGCAGTRSCLCCHSDFLACKFPTEEKDKDNWFIWDRGQTVCSEIKNCCSVSQRRK